MGTSVVQSVRGSNTKLQMLLARVREALAGRANFGVEDLRAIAEPVAEMAPIIAESTQLRAVAPELHSELEIYTQNLGEMQTALDRVRCVLLARCASLEAQRGHLETVSLWAAAWQQTQPSDRI
jgi:hypothetical protein